MTSIVILSVGLVTLSSTAARIHGMRLSGNNAGSRSAGELPERAPGSVSCQRSSAATTAESEPSARRGSTCGKPKALTAGAPTGAACAMSATYGLFSATIGTTAIGAAELANGAADGAGAAALGVAGAAVAAGGGAGAGACPVLASVADVEGGAAGTATLSARSGGATSLISRLNNGSSSLSSWGRSSLRARSSALISGSTCRSASSRFMRM